jgi:FkbM family methyltransferase
MNYLQKFKTSILWKKISYSDLYQQLRFPLHLEQSKNELRFYRKLIGSKNKLIFDVGANSGEKTAIFRKIAKNVVCFEPFPNSVRTLKARFAWSNVRIMPIAISDKISLSEMYVVEGRETLNSINGKQLTEVIKPAAKGGKISIINVSTETLDMAIAKFGTPEYIKIDVEGNEKEVIAGLSKPVRFLSFENCTPNFLQEGIASIEHLEIISAGKALFNIYNNGSFLFRDFSSADLIKDHLKSHKYGAAEIFCCSL